jgi:hypothetical protein
LTKLVNSNTSKIEAIEEIIGEIGDSGEQSLIAKVDKNSEDIVAL